MLEEKENMPKQESPETKDMHYWRSFEDLYKNPQIVEASHHEFKEGVTDDFNPSELSHISRRKFLALVGASAALAGAGWRPGARKANIRNRQITRRIIFYLNAGDFHSLARLDALNCTKDHR